jgi:hypothetical protein
MSPSAIIRKFPLQGWLQLLHDCLPGRRFDAGYKGLDCLFNDMWIEHTNNQADKLAFVLSCFQTTSNGDDDLEKIGSCAIGWPNCDVNH